MRLAALWLFAIACSSGGNAASPAATSAESGTAMVESGRFEKHVLLSSELDAVNSVEIVVPQTDTWQLTISWLIEDGTHVNKGDKIVEFDNSTFTAQLESQRLMVKQAVRDYATGRHLRAMTVADKESAVAVATLERDKAALNASVDRDLISERDYEERQLALEKAAATLLSASADLRSAVRSSNLDLDVKRIAADKAERQVRNAEVSIAALTVAAPEDGVAMIDTHRWMQTKLLAGDTVQPGWTVARLPDLSEMVVRARLSDVDDGNIEVGMPATIVFDADPSRVVSGKVTEVSAVAGEVGRDALLRAFHVTVALDEPGGSWARPGMSARVEVVTKVIEKALLVPRAAISWSDGVATARTGGGASVTLEVLDCNDQVCAISEGEGSAIVSGSELRLGAGA